MNQELGQVKLIMAPKKPNILDTALLRPGRLDRKIKIPLHNKVARLDIMRFHSSKTSIKLPRGFKGLIWEMRSWNFTNGHEKDCRSKETGIQNWLSKSVSKWMSLFLLLSKRQSNRGHFLNNTSEKLEWALKKSEESLEIPLNFAPLIASIN